MRGLTLPSPSFGWARGPGWGMGLGGELNPGALHLTLYPRTHSSARCPGPAAIPRP